ncbi:MAG: hypothetical protein PWQ76_1136 [Clostridiales bacterium]|nr:hypothetical protein [Clostridiales bacterium]
MLVLISLLAENYKPRLSAGKVIKASKVKDLLFATRLEWYIPRRKAGRLQRAVIRRAGNLRFQFLRKQIAVAGE